MDEAQLVQTLNQEILSRVSGKALQAANLLLDNPVVKHTQSFANIVSTLRLRMNDHGQVHMRKVALYSLQIAECINKSNLKLSGQIEGWCEYEDSLVAILCSALLHDTGMSVARQNHEYYSLFLMNDVIKNILDELYGKEFSLLKHGVYSLIIESITGHMGHQIVHSYEAGIILVADGCDMEFGRAKPSAKLHGDPRVGDIHQYSASAISKVAIRQGDQKPIHIDVTMLESVGFFQIEEVLMFKINKSTIRQFIELTGTRVGKEPRKYL